MSEYNALHNSKPPKNAIEFVKFLNEWAIGLPELKPGAFYIYDPELAAKESSKTELDYLKIYER